MTDSLRLDSTRLAAFQQDPRFDYDRELVGGDQNVLEWLSTVVSDWLEATFDVLMDSDVVYYSLIVFGALLVLFLAWIVWKKNPKLFMRQDTDGELDYDVTGDTIYGVDFEADIREALYSHDYRQDVRLLYLQTLKQLSDSGCIDWQPSKTPTQYVRQYAHPAFAQLSRHFIRVRYGNHEATEALFQQMKLLQQSAISYNENSAQPISNSQPSTLNSPKGGEA